MTEPNRAARRAKAKPPAKGAKSAAKAAGGGRRHLNLDTARAARQEARGASFEVTLGGEDFALPSELPVEAVEAFADLAELQDVGEDDAELDGPASAEQLRAVRHALSASLAVLFCDEGLDEPRDDDDRLLASPAEHGKACAWRRFAAHRPTLEDQLALWEGLLDGYGVSLGEALARTGSPVTTGAPSSTT